MRIIAELYVFPSGAAFPRLYALSDVGGHGEAVTATLLDFISELPPGDAQFEGLLRKVESGEYASMDPLNADWSENDKLVWLLPPYAPINGLCISNENIEAYSVDGGAPQIFSVGLFREVRQKWREFIRRIEVEGKELWLGEKIEFEVKWPCDSEGAGTGRLSD